MSCLDWFLLFSIVDAVGYCTSKYFILDFFNSHFLVFQDLVHKCVVPQEVWDLRLFKQMPSVYVMHCLSIFNYYV